MSFDVNLGAWNFQVLMLVQSLVGAVSPNFRMVALCLDEDEWVVKFYLEKDIKEDTEEIEEVFCQYMAYQDHNLKCRHEVTIGQQDIPGYSEVGRIVYRRRENSAQPS